MRKMFLFLFKLGWRVACLLLIWHVFLVFVAKKRASFAESNLVSNQIRIQSLTLSDDSGIALVGSSLMARISPDSVSETTGISNISQLGLDGGRSGIGLSLLKNLDRKPSFLVLEGNSLSFNESSNDEVLLQQASTPIFKIAQVFPWVRAKNRPSAIAYSRLKHWNDLRKISLNPNDQPTLPPFGFKALSVVGELSTSERKRAKDLKSKLDALGIPLDHILIVMLPNGDGENLKAYRIAHEISKQSKIAVLDLKGHSTPGEYRYTDGRHLNIGSGIKVATLIGTAIKELKEGADPSLKE